MTEANEAGYFVDTPWTWRERLGAKLFPRAFADLPMPKDFHAEDVVTCRTAVSLSWRDRLRVLVSGRLWVETRTATEYVVGRSETTSTAYPTWRF